MDWFKSYNGASVDPKYQLIAHKAKLKTHEVALLWWAFMDHASRENDRGDVSNIDFESLDFFYQFDGGISLAAFNAFCEKGMIVDGKIFKWDDRQKSPAAERQKRYRDRKRVTNDTNSLKRDVTLRNGDVSLLEEKRREESRRDKKEEEKNTKKKPSNEVTLFNEKTLDDWFDDFWREYPEGEKGSGRKGSKQKSKSVWMKIVKSKSGLNPFQMVQKAKEYSAHMVGHEKYVKGCAAWLNGDFWMNVYTPRTKRGNDLEAAFDLLDEKQKQYFGESQNDEEFTNNN